jgi:hypothetical protein
MAQKQVVHTLRVQQIFSGKQITKLVQPSIKPQHLGGNGRAGALAAIGKNTLNMLFTENLLRRGVLNRNIITKYQVQLLTAQNISRCVPAILSNIIPPVIPVNELMSYNDEEQKSLLEAYVGFVHEFDKFKFSERSRRITFDIILSVKQALPEDTKSSYEGLFAEAAYKNYRTALVEVLQSCEYKIIADLYTFEEFPVSGSGSVHFPVPVPVSIPVQVLGATDANTNAEVDDDTDTDTDTDDDDVATEADTEADSDSDADPDADYDADDYNPEGTPMLVVATFAIPDEDLVLHGFPAIGEIKSGICPNKRLAAEEVAKRVFELFCNHPNIPSNIKACIDKLQKSQLESGKKILGFTKMKVAPPQKSKIIKKIRRKKYT